MVNETIRTCNNPLNWMRSIAFPREFALYDGSLMNLNETDIWMKIDWCCVATILTELDSTGMVEFISDGNLIIKSKPNNSD